MKKLKISIASLAIIFAIGATFTPGTAGAVTPPPTGVSLYWFDLGGSFTNFQTKAQEIPMSPCDDLGPNICERGYTQAQLLDPNDPEQGPKPLITPTDVIKKP